VQLVVHHDRMHNTVYHAPHQNGLLNFAKKSSLTPSYDKVISFSCGLLSLVSLVLERPHEKQITLTH